MSDADEKNSKRPDGMGDEPTRSFDSSAVGPGGHIGPEGVKGVRSIFCLPSTLLGMVSLSNHFAAK